MRPGQSNTPFEEALAREALPYADLRAFLGRIERFAQGADHSEKFAEKLAAEMSASYRDDPDLGPLIPLLGAYRSKVGQVEAEQACRAAITAVLLRLDGPRLPWRGIPGNAEELWQMVFRVEVRTKDADMPGECPLCRGDRLRHYWRLYRRGVEHSGGTEFVGHGGGWAWCSDCLAYGHFSALVPNWWKGDERLDVVPLARLEHTPEFLERALRDATKPGGSVRARLEARDRFQIEGRGTTIAARMLEGEIRAGNVLELAIRPSCRLTILGIELFTQGMPDPGLVGFLVKTDCFNEVLPGLTFRAVLNAQC